MDKNNLPQNNVKNTQDQKNPGADKKPNEQYGFYFSSSLKITDPQTGKVLVQMRCD